MLFTDLCRERKCSHDTKIRERIFCLIEVQCSCSYGVKELVVTNSIDPKHHKAPCKKVRVVSIAELMGDAIWRIANEQSVSSLFE